MNSMRKIFCILMATVLAAFALPGVAGDNGKKLYSLQMSVPPAQTTAPFTVSATITNEGNSTISSFKLYVSGLTIVGVNQPASGAVAGPFPGSSVLVTNMSPVKSGQSFTLTLHVNSCGDGTWSPVAWTGAKLNGQTFDLDLAPGHSVLATPISCGSFAAGVGFTVPDSLNPNCVTGQRGYYDKDGSIPAGTLSIFVTNTVPTNTQLHFRWPDLQNVAGNDPLATFEYDVCGSGPLPEVPGTQVAWLNTDASRASAPGNPAFIAAQDCLGNANFLPEPYGTLAGEGGVGAGDTTIPVETTLPSGLHPAITHPATPFDIVIGTERMTVTGVACGSNDGDFGDDVNECSEHEAPDVWTVVRAVGGTTAASHTSGGLVMSTPLPLLPTGTGFPYTPGSPAQMCIADQGNDEGGGHSTTFIDIGDGVVKLP